MQIPNNEAVPHLLDFFFGTSGHFQQNKKMVSHEVPSIPLSSDLALGVSA